MFSNLAKKPRNGWKKHSGNMSRLLLPFILLILTTITAYDFNLSLKPFQSDDKISILCILNNINSMQSNTETNWLLINAKFLYKIPLLVTNKFVIINLPLSENRFTISIYSASSDNKFSLIGLNTIDIIQTNIKQIASLHTNIPLSINFNNHLQLTSPNVGLYYSTIQYYMAKNYQNITANMQYLNMSGETPNFETVIRSFDNTTIYDLNEKWKFTITSNDPNIKPVPQTKSYYMNKPLKYGYYCLYTNKPNEYREPNCDNVTTIITQHLKMFESAGLTFFVPDNTNLNGGYSDTQSYVLQIRPNQIILETLSKLNISVKFAMWNQASGVQWKINLEYYTNYSDVIYSAINLNKKNNPLQKVYFINNNINFNQTIVELIETDNGKNDIQVIFMWAELSLQELNNGTWNYCTDCRLSNGYKTQSLESIDKCNVYITKNSNLGTQISPSFITRGLVLSAAFSAPTRLNGRTFQLVFQQALEDKIDNIFVQGFNEHDSPTYPLSNTNIWSYGLYKDINRSIFTYDTYGAENGKAFEPSIESGDYYWELFKSCIRVARMEYYFNQFIVNDGIKICNIENELCCNNLTQYNDVWSLKNKHIGDYIVSNNISEVNILKNNMNYDEICAVLPYANTSVFCESNKDEYNYEAYQGPFILYRNEIDSFGSLLVVNISRVGIYRCKINDTGMHFISNTSDCNDISNSVMEYLLGYAAVNPSTAMGRSLYRCQNIDYSYYHVVDNSCNSADVSSKLLGFVL
eukprot:366804_1